MTRHLFLSEEAQLMVDDLARWSGLSANACIEYVVRCVWFAATLRDTMLKSWVATLRRARVMNEASAVS